ncbi:MAG: hypothetical protein WDO18_04090 [Acidobacteriota bacterium]
MIEQIRPGVSAAGARVAIFDFDGTISLIRSGWVDVMVPMMVEILADLKTGESDSQLREVVHEFVWRLTGKETIYQMMEFTDHVRQRGGDALEPQAYKKMYLDRLWTKIHGRIEELQKGHADPEQYMVPRRTRAAGAIERPWIEVVSRQRHRSRQRRPGSGTTRRRKVFRRRCLRRAG